MKRVENERRRVLAVRRLILKEEIQVNLFQDGNFSFPCPSPTNWGLVRDRRGKGFFKKTKTTTTENYNLHVHGGFFEDIFTKYFT